MTTPAVTKRGHFHLGPRARRGAATTEFAILTPLFVLLILGTTYFWEVQHVRLKAAEVVRYVAFERTVRSDVNSIVTEATARYQDLDGSTKTGSRPTAMGPTNRVTLDIRAEDTEAKLQDESILGEGRSGGGMQAMTKVLGALGSTAGQVAQAMGLDPNRGAVRAQVEVRIENGLIPSQLAFLKKSADGRLDVTFKESFFLVHDTWRAWTPGHDPTNSYKRVEELTYQRVKEIAYAGLASEAGALDTIGAVLSVLGLDFPMKSDYLRESVLILHVNEKASKYKVVRTDDTRTVPGDVLLAAYWMNDEDHCFDSCESPQIKSKRGLASSSPDGHYNWPMRAYNCRGNFFQGAAKSQAPESEYALSRSQGKEYFNYGDFACADGPNTSRDDE